MSFMLTDGDVDNADDGGGVDSETVSSGRPSIQLVVLCFAVTVLLGGTVGVVQFSDKKTAVKDDLESASGDGNNTTSPPGAAGPRGPAARRANATPAASPAGASRRQRPSRPRVL